MTELPGTRNESDPGQPHIVGTSGQLVPRSDLSWIDRSAEYIARKWAAMTADWEDLPDGD